MQGFDDGFDFPSRLIGSFLVAYVVQDTVSKQDWEGGVLLSNGRRIKRRWAAFHPYLH